MGVDDILVLKGTCPTGGENVVSRVFLLVCLFGLGWGMGWEGLFLCVCVLLFC